MKRKYRVVLSRKERSMLEDIIKKGKSSAYKIRHANILLKADERGPAWSDAQIAEAYHVTLNTVGQVRKRFMERGLEGAINRKEQDKPSREPVFDGQREAHLIALRCGKAPEGYGRWTLRLLADKAVELKIVPAVSYETIRRTLKKMSSNHICANRG